jgi:hypothetical protein
MRRLCVDVERKRQTIQLGRHGTNAIINRHVRDGTLRIVPVLTDTTPLPVLVAEYKGFNTGFRNGLALRRAILFQTLSNR